MQPGAQGSLSQRGVALAFTLGVLVIAGMLLAVVVFLAFHDQRASGSERRMHHALTSAESGLVDAMSRWQPARLSRLLPQAFDSLSLGAATGGGLDGWLGRIYRLRPGLLLVAVTGRNGSSPVQSAAAESRLGWLVRTNPVDVTVSAALEAGGIVSVGDGADISGRDAPSDGLSDCLPSDINVAGIMADSVAVEGGARIEGFPPTTHRAGGDTGLTRSQRAAYDRLALSPTISLPPGSWFTAPVVTGTHCDAGPDLNWGDPARWENPCGGYLPIVHVAGDATLLGGTGQGILLVDGDLVIQGPYRFSGLVMVGGVLDVTGSSPGVTLEGAVIAARTGFANHPPPALAISYSSCILSRALETSGSLAPLRSRGWKQLF